MRDKELYRQILGVETPWRVADVRLDVAGQSVEVRLDLEPGAELVCPECGKACSGYDRRARRWRHLDTCQFQTILAADVPRARCPEHGVHQIAVPWADPGSGFTALFEALVIDWLSEASTAAVARCMGLTWGAIDTIMRRAVRRGLERRASEPPIHLAVDETSFRKRHDYVTVVTDATTRNVLHVADDRGSDSLKSYYRTLDPEQREGIQSVAMDMWQGYVAATVACVPGAARKIAFDKFHVAQHLGRAVDKVRREEHRALMAEGDDTLKGSKYLWLWNPENMRAQKWADFAALRESSLRTARAWAIKEAAMTLWGYESRGWAERAWRWWLAWAGRSQLAPVKKVARMIRAHLWGIVNAIVLKANSGGAESVNSKIKTLKIRARGFRNKARFRDAIYFHLAGLDLYPATLSTHTNP